MVSWNRNSRSGRVNSTGPAIARVERANSEQLLDESRAPGDRGPLPQQFADQPDSGRVDECDGGEVQAQVARRDFQLHPGSTQLLDPGAEQLAFELERRDRPLRADDSCDLQHGRRLRQDPAPGTRSSRRIARPVPPGVFAERIVSSPNSRSDLEREISIRQGDGLHASPRSPSRNVVAGYEGSWDDRVMPSFLSRLRRVLG